MKEIKNIPEDSKDFKEFFELYIKELCEKDQDHESCGLILTKKYSKKDKEFSLVECDNVALRPKEHFEIAWADHVSTVKKFKILGIYHSHIGGSEEFSDLDKKVSEEAMIPFFVYSLKTKKHNVYIPSNIQNDKDIKTLLENV